MGKPWLLYKVTGSGIGHTSGSSASSIDTKSTTKSSKRGHGDGHMPSSSSCSSAGCMSTIFHLFHQPSFISKTFTNTPDHEPTIIQLKGIEAPRNSLEVNGQEQEPMIKEVASSSKHNQEPNFNTPMSGIQIKTKISRLTEDVLSECSSSSPSTKTPNLVARLMGLDVLPEYSSPRSSLTSLSSSSHATHLINPISKLSYYKHNARSLPATPRISTAARPSMETDHHRRHSLQIVDESTNEYAKKITKQARENISRRVGVDITNIVKKERRRDEHLVVLKPKRSSPLLTATDIVKSKNLDQGYRRGKENEPILLSCSPRLRFLNIENNLNNKPNSNSRKCPPLSSSFEVSKALTSATTKSQSTPLMKAQKCNRIASERYELRLKKVHRQEEPFVKKCNKKSGPLSNHLANVNTPTKFISLKKDMVSTSSTILPQKQRILGLCSWVTGAIAFEEEVEEVVTEIERDLVDTLVDEMAGIIWHVGREGRV